MRRFRAPKLSPSTITGSDRMLSATFLLSVALTTIGGTTGGLPKPRRYAAIALLWFMFGLASELGGFPKRFAGALAALVTLALAMGRAGARAVGWLQGQAGSLVGASDAQSDYSGAPAGPAGPAGLFAPGGVGAPTRTTTTLPGPQGPATTSQRKR